MQNSLLELIWSVQVSLTYAFNKDCKLFCIIRLTDGKGHENQRLKTFRIIFVDSDFSFDFDSISSSVLPEM